MLAGAGSGTSALSVPGDNQWYQILFQGPFEVGGQNGARWRSDEFFTSGSLNIDIPEPGFYFVKYSVTWPQNVGGYRRGVRLVVFSGGGDLGQTWIFAPKHSIMNGGTPPAGYVLSLIHISAVSYTHLTLPTILLV